MPLSSPIQIHSLSCPACNASKDSVTMMLCPKCEQAVLKHFPPSYFMAMKKPSEEDLELTAVKVLEALELASVDAPVALAA